MVNDVLIAESARAIGATVITRDGDYEILKGALQFGLQVVVS